MPNYSLKAGGMHDMFRRGRKKIQILAGGFGNGKTAAVCVRALELAREYPGSNGLIARSTYPKLNDTIRREFYKWCPESAVQRWPTKDDNTLIFKNGTTVNFRYIQQRGKQTVDGNTTSNLLSATYDWIIVDQMEDPEIQHKDFLDLMGRLRGSTPYKGSDPTMPMTGPRWIILTANPTANWFYKKLVKPMHTYMRTGIITDDIIVDPNTQEPMIEIFEGSTYENAHNLESDFIQGLEASYHGQMKDRFLMGKWAAYEGLVYPQFNSEIHMIPKQHMLKMLEKAGETKSPYSAFECFDYGIVSPSCYLLGFTDYEGRVFIIDGVYEPNLGLGIGRRILELRNEYWFGMEYDIDPIWADPAIFRRTVTDGTGKGTDTVARLLKERYDLWLKPGQNDILSGITKVSEYLTPRPGLHYLDPEQAGPAIYFSNELTFIEDEITAYFWKTDKDSNERMDIPNDKNDHAMDCLKYGVSKLPEASQFNFRKPVITPEYLKWQEER